LILCRDCMFTSLHRLGAVKGKHTHTNTAHARILTSSPESLIPAAVTASAFAARIPASLSFIQQAASLTLASDSHIPVCSDSALVVHVCVCTVCVPYSLIYTLQSVRSRIGGFTCTECHTSHQFQKTRATTVTRYHQ
jgi:hypothetical protein